MVGIGTIVKEGKLSSALRDWKKQLSESGKLQKLRKIKDGYVKPSVKRKNILEAAKHREKFRDVNN